MDVEAEIGPSYTLETWTATHSTGRVKTSQTRQNGKNSHGSPPSDETPPPAAGPSKVKQQLSAHAYAAYYDTENEEVDLQLKPEIEKVEEDMDILELEGNFKRRFHGKASRQSDQIF